jgi:FKBP-type peptidyl-prolyl cis-trans isomerase FkpA
MKLAPTAPMKFAAVIFFSLLALAIANIANAEESAASRKEAKAKAGKYMAANKPEAAKAVTLPKDVKKLIVEDMIPGNGKIASKGKSIKVHYTGWLYDPSKAMGRGKQFDTSVGKEPFSFQLGSGKVIKGWEDGFENMKVGGKRKLIIPSELGYGETGAGADIPPNASLMFEVELLDVN